NKCRPTQARSFPDNVRADFDPEMLSDIVARRGESAASDDPCVRRVAFCGRRRRTKEEQGRRRPALAAQGCGQNLRMQFRGRRFAGQGGQWYAAMAVDQTIFKVDADPRIGAFKKSLDLTKKCLVHRTSAGRAFSSR